MPAGYHCDCSGLNPEESVVISTTETTDAYARWIGQRVIPSLGTNDGAMPLAFQGWHHFKEAFSPELIGRAVADSSIRVDHCLDPFGGSGTTALASQMLGIKSTTVEVNPFLADVIRSKLSRYDIDELARKLAVVRRRGRKADIDPTSYFDYLPSTFLQPGVNGRWIFNVEVASRLAAILSAIDELDDEGPAKRLFRVLVGGLLPSVSNVTVSGKGRRYRKNWQSEQIAPQKVDDLFAERAEQALTDLIRFRFRTPAEATVVQGDARSDVGTGPYDLSVFSPPYPNSFDYTDVYNLQLWVLGYLKNSTENHRLRAATLTSHVQLLRAYASPPVDSPLLQETLAALETRKGELWSRWIPDMVGAYFADMVNVLGRVMDSMRSGGQAWLVIGDSRYAGVTIPVAKVLTEIAEARQWTVLESTAIRHMKTSAQQGWQHDLAESLLKLRKG